MQLKQWRALEKVQKLGNGASYCFVRGGHLYVGGNYGAVRLDDLNELLGLPDEGTALNARVSVESYPKSSTADVTLVYGSVEDYYRDIDNVFVNVKGDPARKVDANYLATICAIAKAFGWYVAVDMRDRALHGRFLDVNGVSHGDYVLMGVLDK